MVTCKCFDQNDQEFLDYGFFSIANCNCHTDQPLVIVDRHTRQLNLQERQDLPKFISKYYPGYVRRNIGTGSIHGHWHDHLIKK